MQPSSSARRSSCEASPSSWRLVNCVEGASRGGTRKSWSNAASHKIHRISRFSKASQPWSSGRNGIDRGTSTQWAANSSNSNSNPAASSCCCTLRPHVAKCCPHIHTRTPGSRTFVWLVLGGTPNRRRGKPRETSLAEVGPCDLALAGPHGVAGASPRVQQCAAAHAVAVGLYKM